MEVNLILVRGSRRGQAFRLPVGATYVGRGKNSGLRIPSKEVSRTHCILRWENEILSVQDLDSVNGTFVNDKKVSGRYPIRHGDHLEVGPARFLIQLGDANLDDVVEVVEVVEDGEGVVVEMLEVVEDEPAVEAEPILAEVIEEEGEELVAEILDAEIEEDDNVWETLDNPDAPIPVDDDKPGRKK